MSQKREMMYAIVVACVEKWECMCRMPRFGSTRARCTDLGNRARVRISVRGRIIVSRDAAATAANIRSFESLWRLGIAAEFVLLICAVSLTLIFLILLRPVSKDLALLAVFFNPDRPRRLLPRLRRLFARTRLEHEEVNILRGILASVDQALKKK